ncbi:MAG: arginase family protein [Coriobacteriales bacterium]|nr:arginase family protein [Coriobacteriales bacterium]
MVPSPPSTPSDLALIGVPTFRTAITPTGAHATPGAVRSALHRFSTYSTSHGVDVRSISAVDLGDVEDPDGPQGEARVRQALGHALDRHELLIAIGGDNSATYSVMRAVFGEALSECGLVTVDAHHDLRDGASNGSPVRRLIDAGLPGASIAQVGIADFSNSAEYSDRARRSGITVIDRAEVERTGIADAIARALDVAGGDGREVYADLDVDACDRAVVPGCPAAAPGGLCAAELRQAAFLLANDPRVRVIDITEVDATADATDERTVRLAALLVLEAAAGLAMRAKEDRGHTTGGRG